LASTPSRAVCQSLNRIRTSQTFTGLRVRARLVRKRYTKGITIADSEMMRLSLEKHEPLPMWNYTLQLRS
jgi:hypothetical protein